MWRTPSRVHSRPPGCGSTATSPAMAAAVSSLSGACSSPTTKRAAILMQPPLTLATTDFAHWRSRCSS
eukprot:9436456-Alexandrium_andersonii.AAC.1